MELKEGYKQSEVGFIPNDWEVRRLGELFDFCNGFNADREFYGKGLPFISTLDVLRFSHIRYDDILGKVLVKKGIDFYLVKRGDVLFTRTSETQEEIGTTSVYVGDEPVTFGGFIIRGREKIPCFDERYLGYAFKNTFVRRQITSLGQGGVHVNIGQTELEKVYVPVPATIEQRAIATALSDVDALLSSLDALIAKKRDIKTAAMQELLTGKTRLPGFSGEWVESEFEDSFDFLPTNAFTRAQFSINGTIKNIHYGDILTKFDNHIDVRDAVLPYINPELSERHYSESVFLHEGDIIIANTAEDSTVGKAVEVINVKGRILSGQHTFLCRPKVEHGKKFMGYLLNSHNFHSQLIPFVTGIKVSSISKSSLARLILKMPATKSEQAAIAAVLSDMDAEIAALEARRAKVQALKQGMMQELLTGRTRLLPAGEQHG